ncbi:MAG: radical SAM protein [Bacteroidetes bacterium]|nr:radical SAM protein [Bacteroidota bacterium]
MYTHLFGPVPSRRLGISLGVDLVPHKVCSLNCLYCEVGATTKLTLERKEYILYDQIIEELNHYFAHHPDPDYITFSGSGEPTLNIKTGKIIDFIKQNKPELPVAVLTNGTLLSDKNVRDELKSADVVLPSLDAATEKTFQTINRPAPHLHIKKYIQGIIDFRNEFSGQLWLEIFIAPGYNDNTNDLNALKKAILDIQPDRIQLNTLDRPGTIADIKPATHEDLNKIIDFWKLKNVEIIAAGPERRTIQSYREDAESAILTTIKRRPCTLDDLEKILGLHKNEINKYLDVLEADRKIESIRLKRGLFYQILNRP